MTKEIKAFGVVSGWYYKTVALKDLEKLYYITNNHKVYDIASPQGDYYADIIEDDCVSCGFMVFIGTIEFPGEFVYCEDLTDVLGLYKTLGFVEKRRPVKCARCTFFNKKSSIDGNGECMLNPPTVDGNRPFVRTEWSCSLGQYD